MSKGLSRREFMKTSLVGGAALGACLCNGHFHPAHAQSTNIRFSTWHVPVSREVKTVWEPMLNELKKKSQDKIASHVRLRCAGKHPSTMMSCQGMSTWATSCNLRLVFP
jgi:hypothetical protein